MFHSVVRRIQPILLKTLTQDLLNPHSISFFTSSGLFYSGSQPEFS